MSNMGFNSTDYVGNSIYSNFLAPNQVPEQKDNVYQFHLWKFLEMSMTRFTWKNLPDTVDKRFLELTLNFRSLAVFYDMPGVGLMALRATPVGINNMQDNPTSFTLYGARGNTIRNVGISECVPVWGSLLRWPDYLIMSYYAGMIAEIMTTFYSNVISSRHPVVLVGDDNFKTSLTNIWRQVQEGQPMIGVYDDLGLTINDRVTSLDMKVDVKSLDSLQIAKDKLLNDCYSFLGIDNSNQDKKERLVASEVDANDSQIEHYRDIALIPRQQGVELLNERYGLDASVEWNAAPVDDTRNPSYGDDQTEDDGGDGSEPSND